MVTSLEVSVKIRSRSSTSSANVGLSMGLYCQHSRINKYLRQIEGDSEQAELKQFFAAGQFGVGAAAQLRLGKTRLTLRASS